MNSMLECFLNELKLSCTTEEYKDAVKLLFTYIENIFKNKSCEKYRKIRIANEKFNKKVWCFESCRTLLLLCGFEQDNEFLTLPVNVDITQIHNILLNELREMNILQSIQPLHENAEEKKILNIRSKDDKSMFQEVKPDMTLLSYLVEMGYEKNVAIKGLIATSNIGIQPAMDWIELHPECYLSTIQSGDNSNQSSVSNTSSEFIDGVQPYKDVISSRYSKSLDEKHKFQEKQRLELIKRTKVEKAEEIRARKNLKMNLESEKKQKLEKFEQEKLLRHFDENKKQTTGETQLLKSISHDAVMLRIKLQNGLNIDWETNRNTSLKFLYNYVSDKTNMAVHEFEVVIPHLNKVLRNSHEITLEQEGLFYPNGIVAIQMVQATTSSGNPSVDTMTDNN